MSCNKLKPSISVRNIALYPFVANAGFSNIDFGFASFEKRNEILMEYIDFYNDKRPHQINRYRTPNATEDAYYKRHSDDISNTN